MNDLNRLIHSMDRRRFLQLGAAGLGGMALVAAFWGIWHVISGITLAGFMGRTEAAR